MAVMGKLFEAVAKGIAEAACSRDDKLAMIAAFVREAARAVRDEQYAKVAKAPEEYYIGDKCPDSQVSLESKLREGGPHVEMAGGWGAPFGDVPSATPAPFPSAARSCGAIMPQHCDDVARVPTLNDESMKFDAITCIHFDELGFGTKAAIEPIDEAGAIVARRCDDVVRVPALNDGSMNFDAITFSVNYLRQHPMRFHA